MKRFFEESLLTKSIRFGLFASLPLLALMGCSGDDGKQGEQGESGKPSTVAGPQGEKGDTGSQGEKGDTGSKGDNGAPGEKGLPGAGLANLIRLATTPSRSEVTGIFATESGDLFFNVQHPDGAHTEFQQAGYRFDPEKLTDKKINKGTIGVIEGVNIHKMPENLSSLELPKTEREKQTVQVAYGRYKVLGQLGDDFGGALTQGLGKIVGNDKTTETFFDRDDRPGAPDFNGFVPTGENTGYLFTNWETIPGGMSRLALKKDERTLEWSVDNTAKDFALMLDFGQYGTIANCFGSVSPWGTPLTSEEWGSAGDSTYQYNNPNYKRKSRVDMMAKYLKPTAADASDPEAFPNTYRYHYIVEIQNPTAPAKAEKDGDPQITPVKHYTLGRYAHENAIVMPDNKTVYLSQDNDNGVFFKFVANTAQDLSNGTLYAAKLTQDANTNTPAQTGFDIEWIKLAEGDNATIEQWIAQYDNDHVNRNTYEEGKTDYLTDADAIAWATWDNAGRPANTTYGKKDILSDAAVAAGFTGVEAIPGRMSAGQPMDDRIAFLESRKAARAKGATDEWKKFEGIYVNQHRAKEAVENVDTLPNETINDAYVYFAISKIGKGMTNPEGDIRLNDLAAECGGIYRMRLTTAAEATDNNPAYNVTRIEPEIMGANKTAVDGSLRCDSHLMTEPDNVIVLNDGRLVIGEDAGGIINSLWLYTPNP